MARLRRERYGSRSAESGGEHREDAAGLGTWISTHRIERLAELRESLTRAKLFARVNPLGPATREVDRVTEMGAEVLMLPMFHTAGEVKRFVEIVGGRAAVVLLLETRTATENVASIVAVTASTRFISASTTWCSASVSEPEHARLGSHRCADLSRVPETGRHCRRAEGAVSRSRERLARWHAAGPAELEAATREFRATVARCDTW